MSSYLLTEIAYRLQSNGIGTVGTDLFIGDMPLDAPDGVYLLASPSDPPDNEVDWEYQNVDFYVRFKNTKLGYDKLRSIYDNLQRDHHYQLAIWYVALSEARGQVEDLDRDVQNRKILKQSFRFIYRNSTNIS
jgi:hypothetical protein